MVQQAENLIGVLRSLEDRYRLLLEEMTREKDATLDSDPEKMNSVVVRKQELMAQVAILEKQRHGLLQQMAAILGVPASSLTLTFLSTHLNQPEFKQIGLSLADVLERVNRANEENRALIQHCMELVRNTLGFFQHWLAPASVYGQKGRISDGPLSGKLLSGLV